MDSFIVPMKWDDVYADITEHIEKIVDTSKYNEDRPLQTEKSQKHRNDRDDERWISMEKITEKASSPKT